MSSFTPPPDASTYRDLLLFEERLKTNAASLQRRKQRYQIFLMNLLLVISLLLAEVLFLQSANTSLLVIPYRLLVPTLFPSAFDPNMQIMLNPYIASGLLFVSVTTLVLFFASGMYRDKIAYANRYVPQANRALRAFNVYLNVRRPPLRSRFYIPSIPFFSRHSGDSTQSQSASRSPSPSTRSRSQSRSTASHPLNPIPPSTNPRGELIFSSRVDKYFRDGYEKHRSAFERRREEKERREKMANSWLWKLWKRELPPLHAAAAGASTPTRTLSAASNTSSLRGRRGGATELGSKRDKSGSPARTISRPSTPPIVRDGSLRHRRLETLAESRQR